jgi:hypothetical protein
MAALPLGEAGPVLQLDQWVLDLSLVRHVPAAFPAARSIRPWSWR